MASINNQFSRLTPGRSSSNKRANLGEFSDSFHFRDENRNEPRQTQECAIKKLVTEKANTQQEFISKLIKNYINDYKFNEAIQFIMNYNSVYSPSDTLENNTILLLRIKEKAAICGDYDSVLAAINELQKLHGSSMNIKLEEEYNNYIHYKDLILNEKCNSREFNNFSFEMKSIYFLLLNKPKKFINTMTNWDIEEFITFQIISRKINAIQIKMIKTSRRKNLFSNDLNNIIREQFSGKYLQLFIFNILIKSYSPSIIRRKGIDK